MTSCFDEVTVLCIYYNSKNIIIEGLSSLMDAKKVIVVDNASTDGSAQAIEQALPSVTVIRSETNRGYGSGVNAGLEHVQTPYLLIVNPDAKIFPDDVEKLYQSILKYKNAAIVSPQIETPD